MNEFDETVKLANRILERKTGPDNDHITLSRQFLRQAEIVTRLKADLVAQYDPTADLIHANRDMMLRKHEEAITLIRQVLALHSGEKISEVEIRIGDILDALALFHPMHGESWKGWPVG